MDGMARIRARRGLLAHIARQLGVTRAAVSTWRRVPAERLWQVSAITGLSVHDLRPDLVGANARAAQLRGQAAELLARADALERGADVLQVAA